MEELINELRKVNEERKKIRMNEISENDIKEVVDTLQEYIKNTLAENNLDSEEDIKRFKFAIRNHLNSIYEVRQNLDKEKIMELREIIANEYINK